MKMSVAVAAAALTLSSVGLAANAKTMGVKMVGGAPMYPTQTIVQNASKAHNLTTLVAAVKAAGLVDTLSGPGPFTVFAPTNEAFNMLPPGTVDTLVKPENKAKLTSILTYHVVSGNLDSRELMNDIKDGDGKAMLKTVEGEPLTISAKGGHIYLTDAKGGMAEVTDANVEQSNGVVHIINRVLMP